MSIDVDDESGFASGIDLKEISDLVRFIPDRIRVHPVAELNVLSGDKESMVRLHVEWMDLDGPTGVPSFSMDELRPAPVGGEPRGGVPGGIVVCPQVAARQTYAAEHTVVEEVLLLVAHGVLHPLRYDHVREDERREMFDLQR